MDHSLLFELKQTKPFNNPEEELMVSLFRTTDLLSRQASIMFKEFDLSPALYNVLRILKGAGLNGLPCGEIGNRMVSRDPDITRLLDRMEKRGLVRRARSDSDRRVVFAFITQAGEELLIKILPKLNGLQKQQLGFLTPAEFESSLTVLATIRKHLSRDPTIPGME